MLGYKSAKITIGNVGYCRSLMIVYGSSVQCYDEANYILSRLAIMTSPDPKFVVSHRPVNQRTTPSLPPTKPVSPQVKDRIKAMKARHRFGVPLAEQLQQATRQSQSLRWSTGAKFAGFLMILSALALLFSLIEKSLLIASLGFLGLLSGGLLWHRTRATNVHHLNDSAARISLFDMSGLSAFDQAVEGMGQALDTKHDGELLDQLRAIKTQIARIAQIANQAHAIDSLTHDDQHYLGESLRRYLPDALQSYLQIPLNARDQKIHPNEPSPKEVLQQQLALVQLEYDRCEQALHQSSTEQLLRQQRFLEAKSQHNL